MPHLRLVAATTRARAHHRCASETIPGQVSHHGPMLPHIPAMRSSAPRTWPNTTPRFADKSWRSAGKPWGRTDAMACPPTANKRGGGGRYNPPAKKPRLEWRGPSCKGIHRAREGHTHGQDSSHRRAISNTSEANANNNCVRIYLRPSCANDVAIKTCVGERRLLLWAVRWSRCYQLQCPSDDPHTSRSTCARFVVTWFGGCSGLQALCRPTVSNEHTIVVAPLRGASYL